jgi:hypothetical protein
MIADLVPEPGSTPIAEEYRLLVRGLTRITDEPGAFRPQDYDPISVASARGSWKKRMVDEYASTTVFSSIYAQLVEANATLDMGAVVLRMAQDELRHAEICGRVVLAMGGSHRVRRETAVAPVATHPGVCARERALRNVLVTALSEIHSVAWFVASLERMTDPYLRSVTRSLLADEILHGRFGFHYLAAEGDLLVERPEIRRSLATYLRYVFAVLEAAFVRDAQAEWRRGADGAALGIVDHDLGREVFLQSMESAVVPGLERFGIEAMRAFRSRTLSP